MVHVVRADCTLGVTIVKEAHYAIRLTRTQPCQQRKPYSQAIHKTAPSGATIVCVQALTAVLADVVIEGRGVSKLVQAIIPQHPAVS